MKFAKIPAKLLERIREDKSKETPELSSDSQNKMDFEAILRTGVCEGSRNETSAKIIGYLLRNHGEEKARNIFIAWNKKNSPPLPSDELERVFRSISCREKKRAESWQSKLDRTQKGNIRPTFNSIDSILRNEVSHALLIRNVFTQEDVFNVDTPWGYKKGQKRSGNIDDALRVKCWLIDKYKVEASISTIEEVLNAIADANQHHPVKELLESLEWDGVERIEKAFFTYLGANMPKVYQRAVSRKFFLALIARIYEPGIKFDHLPVFEGKQGIGKSSFGAILVGQEWFMDGLPDLGDKDAALNLQGIWLCEMAELSSLYRSQLEAAKAFISRQTDKVRPPYGKRRVDFPRSCIFYGTTNARDYLTDPTGNRRYWPITVKQVDFESLRRDRLQLLAEAKIMYDNFSEPLYLEGTAKEVAARIQESRRVEDDGDSMQSKLTSWLEITPEDRPGIDITRDFQIDELFDIGPFLGFQKTTANRRAAAEALRREGFKKCHTRKGKRWRQLQHVTPHDPL